MQFLTVLVGHNKHNLVLLYVTLLLLTEQIQIAHF